MAVALLAVSGAGVVGVGGAQAASSTGSRLASLDPCTCTYAGASVAVSGSTAVFGVPGFDDGAGRLFVYSDANGPWTETAELAGGDTGPGDSFGASVAMDASAIVVGAPSHGGYAGSAYVFTQAGSTWTQAAELVGSTTAEGDWFGTSVSVSGSTAVVGAPEHAGAAGAAYVFSGSSGTWHQAAALVGSGVSASDFGYSVALDGSEAVVGEPGTTGKGAAYVFDGDGGSWTRTATLQPPQSSKGEDFGNAVAIRGTTAVIGAWLTNNGGATVFSDASGAWTQVQHVQATDSEGGDDLGASVVLRDGTLVIGGTIDDGNIGAAYVFTLKGGEWELAATVAPAGNDGGDFFSNKALALDGTTLVVGSPSHAGGISGGTSGSADIFSGSGASWSQVVDLTTPESQSNQTFAASLSLSGRTAVVGAPGYAGGAGRAYIVTPDTAGLYVPSLSMVGFDTAANDHFGTASGISGQTAVVGAPGHGSGRAYIFEEQSIGIPYTRGTVRCMPGPLAPDGHLVSGQCRAWTQDAELQPSDGAAGDGFGQSVAVSGTTAVVGAPTHDGGRAYVFSEADGGWTQSAELVGSGEGADDRFGASVAVSGTTVVVGANGHGGGRADVFKVKDGSWKEVAALHGADTASGDGFATSVGLSPDGGTIIAGAPDHGGGGSGYVFTAKGGTWTQVAQLAGSDTAAGDAFGTSVGIGQSRAVVGAPGHDSSGEAYIFSSGDGWSSTTQVGVTEPAPAAGDRFGASASLSGSVALVGGPGGKDDGSTGAGKGYAFDA